MRGLLLLTILVSVPLWAQDHGASDKAKDLYTRGLNALTGSAQSIDVRGGIDLIRRSAELGYGPAQTSIGYIEETGFSVPKDAQQAAAWYKKSAEQGDSLAAWSLGRLYFVGAIPGSRQDGDEWLAQAADAGDPFGALFLADSLFARDKNTAAKYYRQAAEQGLPFAEYRFGLLLKDGVGVPVDKQSAYVWFLTSQQAGVQVAGDAAQALEAELGSANVEKGKTDARELQDKVSRSRNSHGCTRWAGELDQVPSPPPLELERFCR